MTGLSDTLNIEPKVTILIPNWNGRSWLPGCLESVSGQDYQDFQIMIVDNGSTDDSLFWVRQNHPGVFVIQLEENTGFARAVNTGIRNSKSPFVALLNTDTTVASDWLSVLVAKLEKSPADVAAVSPLMLSMGNPDLIDDAGDGLSWYGEASKIGNGKVWFEVDLKQDIFSPSAGASLYRRDFFEKCGLFDEDFFAYLEDVDLGLRGRILGFRYLLVPDTVVYHFSHGSAIDYNFYIKLVTQNRLLLFVKNIPASLIWKHFLQIVYGQIYYLLAFGHIRPTLAGYFGFFKKLPNALKARRAILKNKKIDDVIVNDLLGHNRPGEGISHHLRKALKKIG